MQQLAMKIRRNLEGCTFNDAQRETLIGFALAQSIAFTLPLPSSPVESAQGYFNTHFAINAGKMVSQVNEVFTLPVSDVIAMVAKIYDYRYGLVYRPMSESTLAALTVMLGKTNETLPKVLTDIQEVNVGNEGFQRLNWVLRDFIASFSDNANPVVQGQ